MEKTKPNNKTKAYNQQSKEMYYYYYYYYYYHYYYIRLTAFFEENLGRPAPER